MFIQADNAAKDNKNAVGIYRSRSINLLAHYTTCLQVMFAYLALLVEIGSFTEVYLHFLPPGHTHSNLDQKYSVISQRLRNKDLLTLEQVMHEVDGLFGDVGPFTRNLLVPAIADYTRYFSGFLHSLHGHGTCKVDGVSRRLHAFKFSRSDAGVGVYFKEHDEFGQWRGRWDSPDQPVQLFRRSVDTSLPALLACPKVPLDNVDEVAKHWKVVSDVIRPSVAEPGKFSLRTTFTVLYNGCRIA